MEYRPWPCEMLWTTRSSISGWLRLDISTTDLMAAGFLRASGGRSHSCVTPQSWCPNPSVYTISVALGMKE